MRRKKQILAAVIIVTFMAVSCTTALSPTKLTPKQQANVFMSIYSAEYEDAMAMAVNPNATDAQKAMVVKKKALLVQLWPMIKVYANVIDTGGIPDQAQTAAILDLINQLAVYAGGVK